MGSRATATATEVRADALQVQLGAIHDASYDHGAHLNRLLPGVTPGDDLAAFDLHPLRESLYGALVDLDHGEVARARTTLDRVLAAQYVAPGKPWHGTFPVLAESPAPKLGAVPFVDFDPNWRQFLGVGLALVLERHAASLGLGQARRVEEAIARCVDGERGRLEPTYSNPALLHAWLASWAGERFDDVDHRAEGARWCRSIEEQVRRDGDLAEYNSPTYDGVDLTALGLMVGMANGQSAATGSAVLSSVARRMGQVFHPGLGLIAGPYHRAYDVDLSRAVTLAGLWWCLHGVDAALPSAIDERTCHVHDLFHLPLARAALAAAGPMLEVQPVEVDRTVVQAFGDATAISWLWHDATLGIEAGRRDLTSTAQYAPLVASWFDAHHARRWLAVFATAGTVAIDVSRGGDRVDVAILGPSEGASVVLWASDGYDLDRIERSTPSAVVTEVGAPRGGVRVQFDAPQRAMDLVVNLDGVVPSS